MSNTTKRILSALVLITLVGVLLYLGKKPVLGFIGVVGVLVTDELYCNFFKRKRISFNYLLSQLIFLIPFVYFNFFEFAPAIVQIFINMALVVNAILLIYLFYVDMESNILKKLGDKLPFVVGLYVLLPLIALSDLIHFEEWRSFLGMLLIVNFGMDTGAWFFGRSFGKHKLWAAVSPNKTIEGLVGGVFTSAIIGGISWHLFFGTMSLQLFIFLGLLGLLSHLGDLFQSKIKRQVGIKDSSSLIPGHGGVYDRIDSLMFLVPFYIVALKYFYFS